VLGADGAGKYGYLLKTLGGQYSTVLGTVIDSARQGDELINKRVFLTPSRGWKSSPSGPERK
jgi:hypothetical protein